MGSTNTSHLRFVFVGFLFALAIKEIALRVEPILFDPASCANSATWPAIGHLVIAFFAITMSYVHWAKNITGDNDPLVDVFSSEYILLALDLLLVILYYGLARSAEIALLSADPLESPPKASAVPESALLAGVYALYVLWDFVHDVWREPRPKTETVALVRRGTTKTITVIEAVGGAQGAGKRWGARRALWWRAVGIRSLASVVSLALAVLVALFAYFKEVHDPVQVCLLNGAELANLWLFRSLKVLESPLEDWCSLPEAFHQKQVSKPELKLGAAVLAGLVYVGCFMAVLAIR